MMIAHSLKAAQLALNLHGGLGAGVMLRYIRHGVGIHPQLRSAVLFLSVLRGLKKEGRSERYTYVRDTSINSMFGVSVSFVFFFTKLQQPISTISRGIYRYIHHTPQGVSKLKAGDI